MSTRYSSDYKSLVNRLLWMYGGNVALVSHLTGIPERTLRSWRAPLVFPAAIRQQHPSERQEPPVLLPEKNSETAADDLDTLREHLVRHALTLVTSLSDAMADAPLSERVMALTRLIDRIVKLDDHNPEEYDEMIRVAYQEEDFLDDDEEDWDHAHAHSPRPKEVVDEP
jgi:hypothetical protein